MSHEHEIPSWSVRRWLFTTNHKDIGILYLLTSFYFLLAGGLLSLLMRTQLAFPGSSFLTAGSFNQAITNHGLLMVLWFLSPMAFAFANYCIPLQIGARDLAFPRLNAMSYWLYLFGGLLAALGFFMPGGAIDGGWTVYAPLNTIRFSPHIGVTLGGAGLLMLIASVTMATVNFLVTIFTMRAPGMSLSKMPMFTWGILLTVFMMLYAFPSLGAGVLMLAADRILGTVYFSSQEGGAILWDHIFWFFGHPEVYIVLMPGLAALGEILPVFARRPLYGKKIVIAALVAATAMSFTVWAHHMFLTGINPTLRKIMTLTTEAISIPFGVIMLSFIMTLVRASIKFTTPMLFALGTVALFIIGGVTGVFNSSVALDYGLRGTYWIVGHFHYTMVGGAVTGLIAALYFWWPKMTGRMYSERLGKIHFAFYVLSFNLLFFPMHLLVDMPRRVYTYSPETGWWSLNFIATIGAMIFGVTWLILFANLYKSFRHGKPVGENPWNAPGIEWTISSPPPQHDFDVTPAIMPDGAITFSGLKPDGGSILLHESAVHGEGEETHFSPWPLVIPLGTFVVLLGIGLGFPVLLAGAAIFAFAIVGWGRDDLASRFIALEPRFAEGWPFDGVGRVKLGVWIFLASEVVLFSTLIGAYSFVRINSATWPAPGTIFNINHGTLNTVILLTSSLTAVLSLAYARIGKTNMVKIGLLATFVLGATFLANKGLEWVELFEHGFTFGSGLPATAFFITTGAHGAHMVGGLVVLSYLVFRAFTEKITKENHGSLEYFGLYWHFVDIVWVFLFPLFYLM